MSDTYTNKQGFKFQDDVSDAAEVMWKGRIYHYGVKRSCLSLWCEKVVSITMESGRYDPLISSLRYIQTDV